MHRRARHGNGAVAGAHKLLACCTCRGVQKLGHRTGFLYATTSQQQHVLRNHLRMLLLLCDQQYRAVLRDLLD